MGSVRLNKISKIFEPDVKVVHNIDLEVRDKEFIVLVGPSGCGKSTILRMIAGLEDISEGTILIDDVIVNDTPAKDRDIAMVFQNYALYPHMDVYGNMAFGLKLRNFPKEEIKQRVKQAADILGIGKLLARKPKALSGGQRQRVALGRAIVRKPKVFLFDEPLSNLDANLRVQMRTEISKLHNQIETTMIYVTHDQVEAMSMGDRIVVLKDGRIHQVDTPLNIYNAPADKFVASFIGSPTMNFVKGVLESTQYLKFTSAEASIDIKIIDQHRNKLESFINENVIVGIRPEIISLRNSGGSDARIIGNIDVIETVGNEMFVYFHSGESDEIVARIPPDHNLTVNSQESFYIDTEKLHFFNAETETRIK